MGVRRLAKTFELKAKGELKEDLKGIRQHIFSSEKNVVLMIAMEGEANPIVTKLGLIEDTEVLKNVRCRVFKGTYKTVNVTVVCNGKRVDDGDKWDDPKVRGFMGSDNVGMTPAAMTATLVCTVLKPSILINVGKAGGWSNDESLNKILIPDQVQNHDRRIPGLTPDYEDYATGLMDVPRGEKLRQTLLQPGWEIIKSKLDDGTGGYLYQYYVEKDLQPGWEKAPEPGKDGRAIYHYYRYVVKDGKPAKPSDPGCRKVKEKTTTERPSYPAKSSDGEPEGEPTRDRPDWKNGLCTTGNSFDCSEKDKKFWNYTPAQKNANGDDEKDAGKPEGHTFYGHPQVKDMEAAAIGWVCEQFGMPWLAIKIICNYVDGHDPGGKWESEAEHTAAFKANFHNAVHNVGFAVEQALDYIDANGVLDL